MYLCISSLLNDDAMKYKGCILEFTEKRNSELMKTFREVISKHDFIDITQISQEVVNSECSRFWVSEERAAAVIRELIKGKEILRTMRHTKQEMFLEIYARIKKLMQEQPGTPLNILITKVVNSPAPKFYMKPRCAMEIIYKIKSGFYNR